MLFKAVGEDPITLFEQCCSAQKLETAASYLKVLQNTDGLTVTRRSALKLLVKVLDNDDVELAGELVRFLEATSWDELCQREDETVTAIQDAKTELQMQELLLARYAQKLLAKHQLRHFLLFARCVGHDVHPWLCRERLRAAALETVEDYNSALAAIHLQFYIPIPETLPVLSYPYDTLTIPALPNTHVDSHYVSPSPQLSPPASPVLQPFSRFPRYAPTSTPRQKDAVHASLGMLMTSPSIRDPTFLQESIEYSTQDINFLLNEMLSAGCVEWALVISTALMNIPFIISILQDHTSLWAPYTALLAHHEAKGYRELQVYVAEFVQTHNTALNHTTMETTTSVNDVKI